MMNHIQTPIFYQLALKLCDEILAGKYEINARIPSARELAILCEVNPNTVVKSFELLTNNQIIYNKRGIGYFVSENAIENISNMKRRQFTEEYLPLVFKTMNQLSINMEQVMELFNQYNEQNK
jgi:DNA-binding transcriptional regulator YhcF (GntR family)